MENKKEDGYTLPILLFGGFLLILVGAFFPKLGVLGSARSIMLTGGIILGLFEIESRQKKRNERRERED